MVMAVVCSLCVERIGYNFALIKQSAPNSVLIFVSVSNLALVSILKC